LLSSSVCMSDAPDEARLLEIIASLMQTDEDSKLQQQAANAASSQMKKRAGLLRQPPKGFAAAAAQAQQRAQAQQQQQLQQQQLSYHPPLHQQQYAQQFASKQQFGYPSSQQQLRQSPRVSPHIHAVPSLLHSAVSAGSPAFPPPAFAPPARSSSQGGGVHGGGDEHAVPAVVSPRRSALSTGVAAAVDLRSRGAHSTEAQPQRGQQGEAFLAPSVALARSAAMHKGPVHHMAKR